MAISKERLQELIKEGATIYYSNECSVDVKVLSPSKYECDSGYLWVLNNSKYTAKRVCGYDLERLFETRKQAEWHLKYHRTRTEELGLPTWEEAEKGIEYNIYAPKGCIYRLKTKIKTGYSCDKENPYLIRIEKVGYTNSPHDFEFNEENYVKACDLCVKLFKGEENV